MSGQISEKAYEERRRSSGTVPGEADLQMQVDALAAENKRLHRELELRNCALDAAASGFMIVDMQKRKRPIVYLNRSLAQQTGYEVQELLGKSSSILTPKGEDRERLMQVRDAMLAGRSISVELQTLRKDGSTFCGGVFLGPLRDSNGVVTHYVSVGADITVRKRAEEKFRGLLESAPDAMVIADQLGRTLLVNAQTERLFGYSRAELMGQPVEMLIPERLRTHHPEHRAKYFDSPHARHMGVGMELLGQRKDGSIFPIEISLSPLRTAEGVLVSAAIRDITKRLEAETKRQELQNKLLEEMRQREQMAIDLRLAQKLEAVGRLAAGIAHEINTPIQYVGDSVNFLQTAYSDFVKLLNDYRDGLASISNGASVQEVAVKMQEAEQVADIEFNAAEIPKACERTLEGVERVAQIVRAMKEFSHPDANEHHPAEINHALETALVVTKNEYKYFATVETDFAELPQVTCNIGELNQVFLNLIVNSAHAIDASGKDAATGRIKISTQQVEDQVEIIFSDNGCGIPQENIDKIFDPFFTTKEVGKGTGQGLAITRSIVVDKHGGEVLVDSEIGVGTQFVLRLPINGVQNRGDAA